MSLARADRRASLAALALVVALGGASGCTPTLSAPRGDAHLRALAQAGRAYRAGRMDEAARAYGVAARHAERRVDRDESRYRRAVALERAGHVAEAISTLDAVAAALPKSRRTARALYDASRLRIARGERASGLAGMRRVVREHPGTGLASPALRVILEDFASRHDRAAALAFVRALHREVGESELGDDLRVAEARLLLESGDRAAARAALERALEEQPYPHMQRWDDILWQLADLDEEDHDPHAAVRHLERMLSVHEHTGPPGTYTLPRMPDAALRIARLTRDALHDAPAAERAYERVIEDFPHARVRDDAMLELASLLFARDARDAACERLAVLLAEYEVGRARREAAALRAARCRAAP